MTFSSCWVHHLAWLPKQQAARYVSGEEASMPRLDREDFLPAFLRAGGEERAYAALAALGPVAGFAAGSEVVLAGRLPDPIGCLSGWSGGAQVLAEAEDWLRAQGATQAVAPLLGSAWLPGRVNLGPWDEPPLPLEPSTSAEPWLAAGYTPALRWVSLLVDSSEGAARAGAAGLVWQGRGFSLEPIGPEALVGRAARWLDLASVAWSDRPFYRPLPPAAWAGWLPDLASQVDPFTSFAAFDPEGRPGGLLLATHDPARNWTVILGLAVLPSFQRAGLGSWLLGAAHRASQRLGRRGVVHALVEAPAEGRPSASFAQGRVVRRYALLSRSLVGRG